MKILKSAVAVSLATMLACVSAQAITVDELGGAVVRGGKAENLNLRVAVVENKAGGQFGARNLPVIIDPVTGVPAIIDFRALPVDYYFVPTGRLGFYYQVFGLDAKATMSNPPIGRAKGTDRGDVIVLRGQDIWIGTDGYVDVQAHPEVLARLRALGHGAAMGWGYYKIRGGLDAVRWASADTLPGDVQFVGFGDFVKQATVKPHN